VVEETQVVKDIRKDVVRTNGGKNKNALFNVLYAYS